MTSKNLNHFISLFFLSRSIPITSLVKIKDKHVINKMI